MKRLLLLLFVVSFFAASAFAQTVTTISAIQDTTGTGSPDSPFKDQVVTVTGVVSAESWAFGGTYYLQDGSGPWSGIMVYDPDHANAYGDSIRITGTVTEYYGMTEIKNITEYVKLDSGKTVLPTLVTTGEIATGGINAEAYEGVLIQVKNVAITNPNLGHGEWEVDDGSGPCRVDDAADYYFKPANYDSVRSITGLLNYSFSNTKIEPRLAWDVVEAGKFTRIQRIQQVRYSDLLRAPFDGLSDVSYATNPENPFDAENYPGDTVTVRGVVTMPTGLSYAGAGVKFIFSEIGGGPWSSILSYNPDSTAYPALFEGDIIEMTGYITEYRTIQSNMTEFWISSPIDIVDFGQPVPEPDYVTTGDLRLPVTAEKWGTCLVYIKDATIVDVNLNYELFAVDDGTGSVLVDDDSDSLDTYYSTHEVPPVGTIADSIRGWVYHHYGSYADSTTYKLEPLYLSDILWGAGPPAITNVQRDIAIPTASDAVTVSADVATNLNLTEVALYYDVNGGGYTKVVMTNTIGDSYEGQIPAQALGSFVSYYLVATDDQAQSTSSPADINIQNYCYPVTEGTLSIADIQYTPWELADSPFEEIDVEITGVVTADTAANNNYGAYAIQDATGAWNGLFVFGIDANLNRGDEITVSGKVTDYNPDWHFKWDNNTVILADTFSVVSSGNTMEPTLVASGDLNGESEGVESFEGTLVKIENATLISVNRHDVTFDDGSGTCLVDDDFIAADFFVNSSEGYLYAFGDTLRPGDQVEMIQGVFTFSFGSYKIEVRDAADFGSYVGVDPNFERIPLAYKLEQNFPNPFNPETRIYFEIPEAQQVKIVIYNVLGQKVRTLLNEGFTPGQHVVNWDGCDDSGVVVPTGIYIYRIKAGSFIAARKMMMMK